MFDELKQEIEIADDPEILRCMVDRIIDEYELPSEYKTLSFDEIPFAIDMSVDDSLTPRRTEQLDESSRLMKLFCAKWEELTGELGYFY